MGIIFEELIATFQQAHQIQGPVLVHVATVKGKGYEIAELIKLATTPKVPLTLQLAKLFLLINPNPQLMPKSFLIL